MAKRKKTFSMNLAKALLDEKVITREQYEKVIEAHKQTGKRIGDLFVEMGFITEGVKLNFMKKIFNLPVIKLKGLKIPPEILSIIPQEIAEKYRVIPLKVENNQLIVAVDDPSNPMIFDNLKLVTEYDIKPVLANRREIEEALKQYDQFSSEKVSSKFGFFDTLIGKIIHFILFVFIMFIPMIWYVYHITVDLAQKPELRSIWLEPTNQITFYLFWALWVSIIYIIDSVFIIRK